MMFVATIINFGIPYHPQNAQNASLRSLVAAESIASAQQIQQMHNAQSTTLENSVKLVIYYSQQL